MSDPAQEPAGTEPWWERTPKGAVIPLGFVKIDRAGSTGEWNDLPPDEVSRRRDQYVNGVEWLARAVNAAQPLHWQGDGVMLFMTDREVHSAALRAVHAARMLWNRVHVDLAMSARIAAHAAYVAWDPNTGRLAHSAIDQCGHLEHVTPPKSIAISEDLYLALPESERRNFGPLGVTRRDGIPAYVMASTAAKQRRSEDFIEGQDLELWEVFRRYANSPEIRMLRYVGLRLAKKEPPALDIEEVFVVPEAQVRQRPSALADPRRAALRRRDEPDEIAEADEEAYDAPFARLETLEEMGAPEPFPSVFQKARGVVVLGDPGSGKTTLVRWLATVASGGQFAMAKALGVSERLLPLPVSIGALADVRGEMRATASVADVLARYFHSRNVGDEGELRGFLLRCLHSGDCLVLLDGLDEVRSAAARDEMRAWLETFAAAYPRNRFIVSSRHVGFPGFVVPEGVVTALRPFDDAQVRRYVEAFTRAYRTWEVGAPDDAAAAKEAQQLLEALERSPRLAALARNPFMLAALALVHRAEGKLPRHRVQFYVIFARALCETWANARRIVASGSERALAFEEEAIPILGELAIKMHESHPTGLAPREFIVDTLADILVRQRGTAESEARRVAEQFLERTGMETQILLERGVGRWGFLHLTFQEFFAAAGLHATERFEVEAFRYLFEPRWEEILRLGVGYLALVQGRPVAAKRFIEKVLEHKETGPRAPLNDIPRKQDALAALLAAEAGDTLPRDLQQGIAATFACWVLEMPPSISRRYLQEIAFADLRELVAPPLLGALKNKDESVRSAAAWALGALQVEGADLALLEALKDGEWRVRWAAARGLGALRTEAAVPALIEALRDVDFIVRTAAAWTLGELRAVGAEPALLEALRDKSGSVQLAAGRALGALRAEGAVPALLEMLKDKNENVR
ncbi:MAG: HEAT repeat domain-containing protein, partial [candidate division NC10 bacterium]|nr:HEAT repeat domain-containing protein [candidate division NC10 bacterium]